MDLVVKELRKFINMEKKIKKWVEEIERYLDKKLPSKEEEPKILNEAIRYAVFSGGKRLRPLIVLCMGEIFGIGKKKILPIACGIELIHNFSLVHDDLPGMDNDDFRRGLPTCHKKFGEGIAILAGDTLLTLGFQMLSESKNIKLIRDMATAIGSKGMAGGQAYDLYYKGKKIEKVEKRKIDYMKTGKLFEICFKVPFYFKKIKRKDKEKIKKIAKNFGIAFQIRDDIEDKEGNIEELKKELNSIYNLLKKEIEYFGEKGKFLKFLVDEIYGKFLQI